MKIQNTGDMKQGKLNMLVYGPPGAGKTRFSGTCKPRFNPIIISAESGLLSLKALGHDFDFISVEKFEDIDEARKELRFGSHKYDTVIIDSITEVQQVCMDKILREERREKAEIRDWGTLSTRMVGMIRDFRDMPNLNLIVTALSDTGTDQETGTERVIPLVKGSLKDSLAGYFDEVFYLHAKEAKGTDGKPVIKRALQTQNSGKIVAKDRSGKLPLYVEPDFVRIYEQIYSN